MQNKKPRAIGTFAQLQALYKLKNPTQIKLRIIWFQLRALIDATHGSTPKNRKIMQKFNEQWLQCEQEETRRNSLHLVVAVLLVGI